MSDIIDIVRLAGEKIDLCIIRTDEEAIKLYTTWQNDASINKWVHANGRVTQYNDEANWANSQSEDGCQFCIVVKDTRELIGTCSCGVFGDARNGSIGIYMGTKHSKGYGTEAVKLMVNYLFREKNAHRVELSVLGENTRAIKCYTKAGFKECGRKHEYCYHDGHYDDLIMMEILKEDWEG